MRLRLASQLVEIAGTHDTEARKQPKAQQRSTVWDWSLTPSAGWVWMTLPRFKDCCHPKKTSSWLPWMTRASVACSRPTTSLEKRYS